MSDNDLIRRGDVSKAVQYHVTDDDDRNTLSHAIAALPAVTVGVPCTWPSCGHTAKGQCQGIGVRILAALDLTPAPLRYMGQIMAECDCPREAECQAAGRCIAEDFA